MPLVTSEPALGRANASTPIDVSFAFQPIVDTALGRVFSYEALMRLQHDDTAASALALAQAQACAQDPHRFDRVGRVAAIALAARLGIACHLSLNCPPRSLLDPEQGVNALRAACDRAGLPVQRLILEVTEGEVIEDRKHFARLIDHYRRSGMQIAIDDFGAGYSGLNLLADYQPDYLKIDMNLVRGIAEDGPRQAIVRAVGQACRDLGIEVIAEGVETVEEFAWFCDEGVSLFQGYLFARPKYEALPAANFPALG